MFVNKGSFVKIFSLLAFLGLVTFVACSSKKKQVVAEIGDEKIYLEDYEKQYLKTQNNLDSARNMSPEKRKEFLDLYIKYRLKVKDARDRGMLKSEDIQNDLNQYKSNFITSFLIDKEVVEPQIKELYDRKEYEVRASHILVNLSQQNKNPEDSVKAYQKANEILKKLKDGESFEQVAFEMSDDNSAKQNYGDLYYFTAGMTVPEFEDAIYKMKVGDYTKEIVRTPFGLHIIKLTDKKKRNNGIRASHILIQEQKDSLGMTKDSVATYNKAREVLQRIRNGEDFAKVAAEVSQDPGSATKGGDLGFFDRRRMVQPFDSVAFTLKVGEVSDLVRTPFGWHIIKVTEIKEYEPFEKQKDNLRGDFKRGPMFKSEYNKYLEKARKTYDFQIKEEGLTFMRNKIDTAKSFSQLNLDSIFAPEEKQTVIAEFKDGKITITDVISYLGRNRDYLASVAGVENLKTVINNSADNAMLLKVAAKEGIEKDPDYIAQLTEYENGLLSFKIDQEELWRNIKITPEELSAYYESNKDKYSYTDSNMVKTKPFEDVKSEISNTLQQERFKQLETQYVENLKKKYPVKVNEVVLIEAFKN
ncbi:MAG: peptidylprolyl isomerase [Ignavibacteria bacterium]|nr:peptidylprolyl isomerase [Ignavibacteria bacterium]